MCRRWCACVFGWHSHLPEPDKYFSHYWKWRWDITECVQLDSYKWGAQVNTGFYITFKWICKIHTLERLNCKWYLCNYTSSKPNYMYYSENAASLNLFINIYSNKVHSIRRMPRNKQILGGYPYVEEKMKVINITENKVLSYILVWLIGIWGLFFKKRKKEKKPVGNVSHFSNGAMIWVIIYLVNSHSSNLLKLWNLRTPQIQGTHSQDLGSISTKLWVSFTACYPVLFLSHFQKDHEGASHHVAVG